MFWLAAGLIGFCIEDVVLYIDKSGDKFGPHEERIALRLLVATWALHLSCCVGALTLSNWLWIVPPIYITTAIITTCIFSAIYRGFKNDETTAEKIKIILFLSSCATLIMPWLIWHVKREYVEDMIRDIIE